MPIYTTFFRPKALNLMRARRVIGTQGGLNFDFVVKFTKFRNFLNDGFPNVVWGWTFEFLTKETGKAFCVFNKVSDRIIWDENSHHSQLSDPKKDMLHISKQTISTCYIIYWIALRSHGYSSNLKTKTISEAFIRRGSHVEGLNWKLCNFVSFLLKSLLQPILSPLYCGRLDVV